MSDDEIKFSAWVPPGFWTCAKGTPLADLARVFSVPPASCIELSAREWHDEPRVFQDLERAFSFDAPWGLNWHAAGDRLSDFRATHPRYLVVIREIPEAGDARFLAAEAALAIGTEYPTERAQSVVLEGWAADHVDVPWDKGRPTAPVRDIDDL